MNCLLHYPKTFLPDSAHLDSTVYREKIRERSDETIANIAITLIHQCNVLVRGLIEWIGSNGQSRNNTQPPIKPNQPINPTDNQE